MATTYFILKNGIAPPGLREQPDAVKLLFWQWVVDLGLKRKDWELARGLNAKGEPLPGIAEATRKHRKSEMTPTGKGDPRAPYLMPGRGLSRTRSLLFGKAHKDYAEFGWRYDAWTGDQWGRVLAHHARRGKAYDVVGLSPKGVAWVAAQAAKRWRAFQAGTLGPLAPAVQAHTYVPAASLTPGRTNLDYATFGIGGSEDQARRAIAEGRSSGFMGPAEWAAYFRGKAPALAPRFGQSPSVTRGRSNVLLQSVWNVPTPPPTAELKRAAMPPAAPPKPKAPPAPAYRRIATEEEAAAWGERHYAGTVASLTPGQRGEVRRYSGTSFELNKYLRGQVRDRPPAAEAIPALDAATTAKPLPEDVILYRGLGFPEPVYKAIGVKSFADIEPGMLILDPGYTSTTLLREKAFEGILMEIRARKGTAGVWFGEASALPSEAEFLLAREVDVFRVVEVRRGAPGERAVLVVEALSSRDLAADELAELLAKGRLKPS